MKATCIKWISEENEPQINNIYARSTPLNLTRTKNKPLLLLFVNDVPKITKIKASSL